MSRAVREELAHVPVVDPVERRAEVAALCRFAGALHLAGGEDGPRPSWEVATSSGAVARRLHQTMTSDVGLRPAIQVHRPAGLRRDSTYLLRFPLPSGVAEDRGQFPEALRGLHLVDGDGRPVPGPPHLTGRPSVRGWLRGAAMARLTVSAPGRPTHLEIVAPDPAFGRHLVELLIRFGAPGARSTVRRTPGGEPTTRVVLKSGEQAGAVLAGLGGHHAFLERDLRSLERSLRSDANRAANADRANLDRTATAAARQVAEIERALERVELRDLPAGVRETALARLANPGASLGQIGALLDPPVARGTVHRRIARLFALADTEAGDRSSGR